MLSTPPREALPLYLSDGDGSVSRFGSSRFGECDDLGCGRSVILSRLAYEYLREQGKPVFFSGHLPDEDAPLAAERLNDDATLTANE